MEVRNRSAAKLAYPLAAVVLVGLIHVNGHERSRPLADEVPRSNVSPSPVAPSTDITRSATPVNRIPQPAAPRLSTRPYSIPAAWTEQWKSFLGDPEHPTYRTYSFGKGQDGFSAIRVDIQASDGAPVRTPSGATFRPLVLECVDGALVSVQGGQIKHELSASGASAQCADGDLSRADSFGLPLIQQLYPGPALQEINPPATGAQEFPQNARY